MWKNYFQNEREEFWNTRIKAPDSTSPLLPPSEFKSYKPEFKSHVDHAFKPSANKNYLCAKCFHSQEDHGYHPDPSICIHRYANCEHIW